MLAVLHSTVKDVNKTTIDLVDGDVGLEESVDGRPPGLLGCL